MTSNLGSQMIQEMADKNDYEKMKAAVMETVGEHFRPEFINRLDEIVVFHPLTKDQIKNIATIQIGLLKQRLADKEIGLDIGEEALAFLADSGFDPVYGARPLKRAIQQHLENPLAQDILSGKFEPGSTIKVKKEKKGLSFS